MALECTKPLNHKTHRPTYIYLSFSSLNSPNSLDIFVRDYLDYISQWRANFFGMFLRILSWKSIWILYFSLKILIVDSSTQSAFASSVNPKLNIHLIKSTLGKEMAEGKGQGEPLHSSDLGFLNACYQTLPSPFCLVEKKLNFYGCESAVT